jgi:chromosome segregation ATPase
MEAAAEASGEAKVAELQKSLEDTQQRLGELQQQQKDTNLKEQQAEVDNFRKKEAQVSLELRQARKDLRKEVVSLETRIEWLNILAMPLAVTLAGIMIAVVKRKKNSAK